MADTFTAYKDKVIVTDLEGGMQMSTGGIILTDDNMRGDGIRERWAKVYKVGPNITEVKPGEWVFLKHGRWTSRFKIKHGDDDVWAWMVEWPEAVLLVSEDEPSATARKNIAAPDRVTPLIGL